MTSVPPPVSLILELTHRCPLSCPYCSNPVALAQKSQEQPFDYWQTLIRQAADLGVLHVHFTGGEPLLYANACKLVRYAHSLGLYTNLITSGITTQEQTLQLTQAAQVDHVQLSIQDALPEQADSMSGLSKSWERKRSFAQHIGNAHIPLTINAVIHRHNAQRVEEMIALAAEWGAERIEIAHTQYYGWGLLNRSSLIPSRAQMHFTQAVVERERQHFGNRLKIDFVIPDYYARYPKACMGGWGRQAITVSPEGYIMPCHAASTIADVTFETITDRSLADIWYNGAIFSRYRGIDVLPASCKTCDRREIDWGGCRCQAIALTGSSTEMDPACQLSHYHQSMGSIAENEAAHAPVAPLIFRTYKQNPLETPRAIPLLLRTDTEYAPP